MLTVSLTLKYSFFTPPLSDLGNYSLEVHFVGEALDTGRRIKDHSFQSTGDVIKYTFYNTLNLECVHRL